MNKSNRAYFQGKKYGKEVKIVRSNDFPWIFAGDVSKIMGNEKQDIINRYPVMKKEDLKFYDGIQKVQAKVKENTRARNMWCISLPALYDLIIKSEKPIATDLYKWLYEELIPHLQRYEYKLVDLPFIDDLDSKENIIPISQANTSARIIRSVLKDARVDPQIIKDIIMKIYSMANCGLPID